jgi:hypothetical protein
MGKFSCMANVLLFVPRQIGLGMGHVVHSVFPKGAECNSDDDDSSEEMDMRYVPKPSKKSEVLIVPPSRWDETLGDTLKRRAAAQNLKTSIRVNQRFLDDMTDRFRKAQGLKKKKRKKKKKHRSPRAGVSSSIRTLGKRTSGWDKLRQDSLRWTQADSIRNSISSTIWYNPSSTQRASIRKVERKERQEFQSFIATFEEPKHEKLVIPPLPPGKGCMRVKTVEESLNHATEAIASPVSAQTDSFWDTFDAEDPEDASINARKIHFGDVEVREHLQIIGDNPACSPGPPVGLGWKFRPKRPLSVDDYERRRLPRRDESGLRISRLDRIEIVRSLGYTNREILLAENTKHYDRRLRFETLFSLHKQEKRKMKLQEIKNALKFEGKSLRAMKRSMSFRKKKPINENDTDRSTTTKGSEDQVDDRFLDEDDALIENSCENRFMDEDDALLMSNDSIEVFEDDEDLVTTSDEDRSESTNEITGISDRLTVTTSDDTMTTLDADDAFMSSNDADMYVITQAAKAAAADHGPQSNIDDSEETIPFTDIGDTMLTVTDVDENSMQHIFDRNADIMASIDAEYLTMDSDTDEISVDYADFLTMDADDALLIGDLDVTTDADDDDDDDDSMDLLLSLDRSLDKALDHSNMLRMKATEANTIKNAGSPSLTAKTIDVEEELTDGEEDDDDGGYSMSTRKYADERSERSESSQTVVVSTDDDGEREFEC